MTYLADTFIPEPESLYERGNNGSEATRSKHDSLTRIIGSSVSHRNLIRNQAMNIYVDSTILKTYHEARALRPEENVKWQSIDPEEKAYTSKVY